MLRYKFREEFGITEEDGTPIKDFTVQMYMNEEGIAAKYIKDMIEKFAAGFYELLAGDAFAVEKDVVFDSLDSCTDDGEKGWM
jgi:hypothetical protein